MNSEEIKKLRGFVIPPEKIAESNSNVSYKNFSQDSSESQIFRENSDAIDKLFTLDPSKQHKNSGSHYHLGDKIAQGGMGVVFRGKQSNLRREVAIKKMLSGNQDQKRRGKFISESLVTAYLEHPNIVPVHDLAEDEQGKIFLAMKLVGGREWKELLHPKTVEQFNLSEKYDLEGHLRILLSVSNAVQSLLVPRESFSPLVHTMPR